MPDVIAILATGTDAGLIGSDDRGSSLGLVAEEFLDASLSSQYLERRSAIDKIMEAKLLLLAVDDIDDIDDSRDRELLLTEAKQWCEEAAVLAGGAFDSYLTGEAEAMIATIDELTG